MHIDKFIRIATRLEQAELPGNAEIAKQRLAAVEKWILKAEMAWSGSWLGYHSRVYFEQLKTPPPEAKFSREWGLLYGDGVDGEGSVGNWHKYRKEDVVNTIWLKAGKPNLLAVRHASSIAARAFRTAKAELTPLMSEIMANGFNDETLVRLAEKISQAEITGKEGFISKWTPGEVVPTKDDVALSEGMQTPPHLLVKAEIWSIRHPFMVCGELAKTARWIATRIEELTKSPRPALSAPQTQPTIQNPVLGHLPAPTVVPTATLASTKPKMPLGICVGHGRSLQWKLVRDHVKSTLNRPWTEYNRVPVAGLSNVARLAEIFRQTCFAILVLTEEDIQTEGAREAELNLVHTAGLFQGRLGINRTVVLIEEGCGDLRLLQDLPQIRFPELNISRAFGDLQILLEQEKIIST